MFISAIVPEVYTTGDEQGEETGRVLVKGWCPTYNGIEPLELIAPVEDGIADAILSEYEIGQTVEFYGNIINSRVTEIIKVPVKIGKPKETTKTTYVNELIIDSASEPYEEGVFKVPYEADAIKKAITVREGIIEERKAKANSSSSNTTAKATPSTGRRLPSF